MFKLISIIVLIFFSCLHVNAQQVSYTLFSNYYEILTGNCTGSIGNVLPQQNLKKLIVDNSLPNGSVLYSWSYGSLIGENRFSCNTFYSEPVSKNPDRVDFRFEIGSYFPNSGYFATNNPGIGLKLYTRPKVIKNTSGYGLLTTPPSNIETSFGTFNYTYYTTDLGNGTHAFLDDSFTISLEFRAELVKIGKISELPSESSLLIPNYVGYINFVFNTTQLFEQLQSLDNDIELGIDLVQGACRLSTPSDYAVDLGSLRSVTSVPQYGDVKPIVIGLDCNGKPNNVDISFQDTSGSSLSNGSVRLHDSSTGNPIEGLEAQMTYNGVPIMVNNSMVASNALAKINLGSLGQSQSQTVVSETFGVRFVQRGPIAHVGPVKGTVNIFVTYN